MPKPGVPNSIRDFQAGSVPKHLDVHPRPPPAAETGLKTEQLVQKGVRTTQRTDNLEGKQSWCCNSDVGSPEGGIAKPTSSRHAKGAAAPSGVLLKHVQAPRCLLALLLCLDPGAWDHTCTGLCRLFFVRRCLSHLNLHNLKAFTCYLNGQEQAGEGRGGGECSQHCRAQLKLFSPRPGVEGRVVFSSVSEKKRGRALETTGEFMVVEDDVEASCGAGHPTWCVCSSGGPAGT